MSPILSGLDIAQQALRAQQLGLDIAQRNIANVNTPGYSRLRVEFESGTPRPLDPTQAGGGVVSAAIVSYRNRYVDYSISQELQGQGEQQATLDALQQVEALFNDGDAQGLADALTGFFNSFSSLANTPEDLTLRQQVLQSAEALADEFHQLYSRIQSIQSQQDRIVSETVEQINTITSEIARLNVEAASNLYTESPDQSAWRDQRQKLLEQLSGLVDIVYYEDSDGMVTVTTKGGALLASGAESQTLSAAPSALTGSYGVMLNGADITSSLQSGKLGGALNIRNSILPAYLGVIDDMAATLASAVNAQHAQGVDLSGTPGGDFFVPFTQPVPGSNAGAARSLAVAITDPDLIAAAGAGRGPGDNTNARLLAGIKDQSLFSAGTADQAYADLVFRVATDMKNAEDQVQIQKDLLQQLNNQRDSLSGVSLDDEAVSIVKFQRAYQASARFVTVLNALSDDLLRILGG